ncbi:MAG: GNAT family N-acetyltransferase [Siphonobacter aquaeclarae]|nr:GNAT family N-acetyltransferase [Siphonobacter aquaeclarae]
MADFVVSTDKSRLDIGMIHDFLSNRSYWAKGIPRELVEKSIAGARCYGVYEGEKQVGFARLITDEATFGYLADVFILEEYRGNGVSKLLVAYILEDPALHDLRRWVLVTADAHTLYSRFGFSELAKPERYLEKVRPNPYGQS